MEICGQLDHRDTNFWKKLDKSFGTKSHSVMKPMRDENGEVHFEDKDIEEILRKTHIPKSANNQSFDEDWQNTVNNEVTNCMLAERRNLGTQDKEYNRDISLAETRHAIAKVKPYSDPGPDKILPIMIKKGGAGLTSTIHHTFQSCWKQGEVPKCWTRKTKFTYPNKTNQTTVSQKHIEE